VPGGEIPIANVERNAVAGAYSIETIIDPFVSWLAVRIGRTGVH
jgi:hypothetical protein